MKYLSDVGINKAPENGDLDVAGDIYSNGEHIFLAVHPVGSIYISVSSVNPGTLFGGTWSAYAQGRTLVGKAASGTFGTAGATMGAETHTLTEGELPSISGHARMADNVATNANAGGKWSGVRDGVFTISSSNHTTVEIPSVNTPNRTLADTLNINFGNNQPHDNIQPSIVVYMWQRTA